MASEIITKPAAETQQAPNLPDYETCRQSFAWEQARQRLDGLPGGQGLNIAHEAVDRHASGPGADRTAIRWLDGNGAPVDISFGKLREQSNRFANVLTTLGVRPGERIFVLLGRVPALYATVLGTLKNRSVLCPLFSAFGPEPIQARMSIGDAVVLVTTEPLYRRKVQAIRNDLPALRHVLIVGDGDAESAVPDTYDFDAMLSAADPDYSIPPTDPEDPALLHFTSGTTGKPKGALHVHDAVIAHAATGAYVLDLRPDDIYWCTADPGWVTGMSYGIIAPLVLGATSLVDSQEFDPQRWLDQLAREAVSVWYTAPTAIRMLMRTGTAPPAAPALRHIASVGEPLNPEVVHWGAAFFGLPIHDTWWQTETGAIMIANYPAMPIKPGSMGQPMPGIEAAIIERSDESGVHVLKSRGVVGELALKTVWPSMFRGYLHDDERYRRCFADGWYLSGDLARQDEDGYFWFVGRADDVIQSAGHLIGPFEVESTLMEHPAVAEAGVIGKPDPVVAETVKAFVCLKPGHAPGPDLRRELLAHARRRLGAAVAPREIEFRTDLPKTRSGKIMRRLLKARELGHAEGDLSTLEKHV